MLNEYEIKKYDTIEKLEKGELIRKEATYELNLSLRQIDRLRIIYHTVGKDGFIHKGRGKIPHNKKIYLIIEELKQLYLNEYYDYNFVAFHDELMENKKYKDKYGVSYSALYKEFLSDDIISPIAHKGTIKLYNKKMNNAINIKEEIPEEKVELFSLDKLHLKKHT